MHELQRRGKVAHDTDVDCLRCSKQTGEAISFEEAKRDGYDWIYPMTATKELKDQSRSEHVFLLGFVDNFDEVRTVSDDFIWMEIPHSVLVHRLDTREKEYGKTNSERESILAQYEKIQSAITPATFKLDATKSVSDIADDLLQHTSTKFGP